MFGNQGVVKNRGVSGMFEGFSAQQSSLNFFLVSILFLCATLWSNVANYRIISTRMGNGRDMP